MSKGPVGKPVDKNEYERLVKKKPKFPGRSNEGNEIPWEQVSE